jgi:hypothetical protein
MTEHEDSLQNTTVHAGTSHASLTVFLLRREVAACGVEPQSGPIGRGVELLFRNHNQLLFLTPFRFLELR